MARKHTKKSVVIDVEPYTATIVIASLRSYLSVIATHLQAAGEDMNASLRTGFYDDAKVVLDEIYDKCIAQTDIKDRVPDWNDLLKLGTEKTTHGENS